jgi:hypothetical protein
MAISNNSTGIRTGVCTSTTRPTAPYEGQHIYETDTDIEYVWNGSAWVVNYVSASSPAFTGTPTAPTAAAGTNTTQLATTAFANAAGGLVYITQATLTGAAVSIQGCFSATYDSYLLQFSNVKVTSAVEATWQLLNGATPITTSTYNQQRASLQGGVWNTTSTTDTAGKLLIAGGNANVGFSFTIFNPFLAVTTVSTSTGIYPANGQFAYLELLPTLQTGTTSCDGIKLIAGGVNWTAGKVIVYGFRQS